MPRNRACCAVAALALFSVACFSQAADWPQWRGPNRDGICTEKGLLSSWPEGGPTRLWQVDLAGDGYSSPVVVGQVLYVTGSDGEGKSRKGHLQALDSRTGAPKWNLAYGDEWSGNYAMARTTPTVSGSRIYLVSSMGLAACASTDGKAVWQVSGPERFSGRNITWGIAESPLVYDNKVIFHPGGPDAAVAALDAATGATVWQSTGFGDKSAYCSPALTTLNGRRQIVTQTENHVTGLAAEDGRVLWKHPHRNQHAVHPNVPLILEGGKVLVASGYGYGAELLQVAGDQATRVWQKKEYENHFQGMILRDGLVYSCSGRGMQVYVPEDGTLRYQVPEVGKAQILMCEAGVVAYSGKGAIFLVAVRPDGYSIAGRFGVDFGKGEHWSSPVIANGILYLRRGRVLSAYDIRAK